MRKKLNIVCNFGGFTHSKLNNENISKRKKYSYNDNKIALILQKIDSLKSIIDLPEDKYINHHRIMIKFLNIREICKKIHNLVGLNDLKSEIFQNIIYLIMFKNTKDINFRLHSVIQGPPGDFSPLGAEKKMYILSFEKICIFIRPF